MKKVICVLVLLTMISATAAYAVSWIYGIQGTVYNVWTVSGITYLRVERSDGSRVTGDCTISDDVLYKCLVANSTDTVVDSTLRCENGFCTWVTLNLIRVIHN